MIKKDIKLLHFTDVIKTYTWYKGSEGMTKLISNYYKENFKIKDERRWQGHQGEWNIEIDYIAAGQDFIKPKESLLTYSYSKIQ